MRRLGRSLCVGSVLFAHLFLGCTDDDTDPSTSDNSSGGQSSGGTIIDGIYLGGASMGGDRGIIPPTAPGECERTIYPSNEDCAASNSFDSRQCFAKSELADVCSPVHLHELHRVGQGGEGGDSGVAPPRECPDYSELNFGIRGPACGATIYRPVCSVPAVEVGEECCYEVQLITNAC